MVLIGTFKCQQVKMKEEIGLCGPKLPIFTTVFEKHKGIIQCILKVAGTAFEIFLIALMYSRIPLSPDNFKTVIKYQTFQTLQTLYPHLRLILGRVYSKLSDFGNN